MSTDDSVSTFEEYLAKYRPDEFEKQRLDAMTPEERTREGIRRAVRDLSQPEPSHDGVSEVVPSAPQGQGE